MGMKIKKGSAVCQVMEKPFEGIVEEIQADSDSGEMIYLVGASDGEQRWLKESQVKSK